MSKPKRADGCIWFGAGILIGGKVRGRFVPDEDAGYFYLNLHLPNAASLQRTEAVMARIQKIAAGIPGIESVTGVRTAPGT